jgi:hypothetical protein
VSEHCEQPGTVKKDIWEGESLPINGDCVWFRAVKGQQEDTLTLNTASTLPKERGAGIVSRWCGRISTRPRGFLGSVIPISVRTKQANLLESPQQKAEVSQFDQSRVRGLRFGPEKAHLARTQISAKTQLHTVASPSHLFSQIITQASSIPRRGFPLTEKPR